jgi:hypothetical protein
MGKAGRKRVLEKFKITDQVARFDEFYRTVVSG